MSNLTNVHTSIISKDDNDISGYRAQFSYPFLAFPHFLSKGLPPGWAGEKIFQSRTHAGSVTKSRDGS